MIKKILPFESLTYHSNLTKEELLAHLQNEVEAEKSFSFGRNPPSYSKSYFGKFYQNSFQIQRVTNYRNSFLPIIKGEIKQDLTGSKINIKMAPHEIVKVFMIIWLGVVTIACLGILYGLLFTQNFNNDSSPATFIPFIMLFAGIAMVVFGFKFESKKSIKDLEELLQAKIIQNNSSN